MHVLWFIGRNKAYWYFCQKCFLTFVLTPHKWSAEKWVLDAWLVCIISAFFNIFQLFHREKDIDMKSGNYLVKINDITSLIQSSNLIWTKIYNVILYNADVKYSASELWKSVNPIQCCCKIISDHTANFVRIYIRDSSNCKFFTLEHLFHYCQFHSLIVTPFFLSERGREREWDRQRRYAYNVIIIKCKVIHKGPSIFIRIQLNAGFNEW